MYFRLYKDDAKKGKEWRWTLIADNGEPIASGEGYDREAGALHAINLIRKMSATTRIHNEVTGKDIVEAPAIKLPTFGLPLPTAPAPYAAPKI
jgi:uncharacterized protein YegP (UPF0339 family)